MKVAILTQPLGHNYGGLLQAFALQKYLKSIGCDVETIDRRKRKANSISVRGYIVSAIRFLLGKIKTIPTAKRQAVVLNKLVFFRENSLAMSSTITTEKMIREYFSSNNFDAVIVGSDQVWRPTYSPSIQNYYLDFLEDIERPVKRIAYAASFGVESWEYKDSDTQACKLLLSRFSAVSVREQSAVELCKRNFDRSARLVVDPTLLLEPDDYRTLIKESENNIKKNYSLSYVLDQDPVKRLIVDVVGRHLNLDNFSIKPECVISQVVANDIDKCVFPSVEEWLQAFSEASFVVTDSFHGTIFSIIFNKPFISIGNCNRGVTRFQSLLSQFGLENRLVMSKDEVSEELVLSTINWESVNQIRKNLSSESKAFIHNSLFK